VDARDGTRLLILETSGRIGEVALAEGPSLLAVRLLDEGRRHARDLAPTVAELLRARGWAPFDLNAVVVSHGPGSYTGLRVGIISAKVLAYATGCRLLLIDTFAAIAAQSLEDVQRVDVLADAQQDKVYVQSFTRISGAWSARTALAIRPFAEWLAARDRSAFVSGPGLRKWAAELEGASLIDAAQREPHAESLLALGLARYHAGERDDPWTAEPLYLRPSAAEQQWDARKA
jgi:tRNA threonylcarbamoyladenosine biosynthesis protein TsaB